MLAATTPSRLASDSATRTRFLEQLTTVERELGTSSGDTAMDPLDAPPGTLSGRFELVRRLGIRVHGCRASVRDRESDDEVAVLKVAIDDDAANRLDDEAEVLAALYARKQTLASSASLRLRPCSRRPQGTPLEVRRGRDARRRPRDRRRLSLDLLDRWGIDLLEALVALDAAASTTATSSRPTSAYASRGVTAPSTSSSSTSRSPGQRCHHQCRHAALPRPVPGDWDASASDSAAERYAAAVLLRDGYRVTRRSTATGETAPQFVERARSNPVTSTRRSPTQLVRFFEKVFARDAKQRHGTAADMLDDCATRSRRRSRRRRRMPTKLRSARRPTRSFLRPASRRAR